MKLKDGILVTKADNFFYLVDVSDRSERFNGMVKLNATGGFVCNLLKEEIDEEGVVSALMKEYDVSSEVAKSDVDKLVEKLKSIDFLVNV